MDYYDSFTFFFMCVSHLFLSMYIGCFTFSLTRLAGSLFIFKVHFLHLFISSVF